MVSSRTSNRLQLLAPDPLVLFLSLNRTLCGGAGLIVKLIGAIAASALKAENYFDRIRVFERRESAGGTWFVTKSVKMYRAFLF